MRREGVRHVELEQSDVAEQISSSRGDSFEPLGGTHFVRLPGIAKTFVAQLSSHNVRPLVMTAKQRVCACF